jgi:hypothetical protein
MPNYFRLIAVAVSQSALNEGIGEAHRPYAWRVHFRQGQRGRVWQGPFSSFALEEPNLLAGTRSFELQVDSGRDDPVDQLIPPFIFPCPHRRG